MKTRKLRAWVIPTFVAISMIIMTAIWFARVEYINSLIG